MTIRVMLADDHAVVRAGHRFLLGQTGDIRIVAEAEDSDTTYHGYFAHRPDVLVLDLAMPGAGGLTVLRRIVAREADARILVFTMHEEVVYAKRALEAGARGYLTKNADLEALPQAIRQIAGGGRYLPAALACRLTPDKNDEWPLNALTQREFEIFCLAARGLGTQEIANRLYISAKTAANCLTQIKHKLGIGTLGELVRLAYQYGLTE